MKRLLTCENLKCVSSKLTIVSLDDTHSKKALQKQLTRRISLRTTLRTMGQQLRQRNKQRRRVLRKKRIAERNRAAATKK